MTEFQTVPCKGCGRPIVWAKDDAGKAIPLDPRAAVYNVAGVSDGVICSRLERAMVSHFSTCPQASQFSKGGKKP